MKKRKPVSVEEMCRRAYEYCWSLGEPYSGAIGGSETWSITHTSIGSVVKVKDAHVPDFELDLTDYDTW